MSHVFGNPGEGFDALVVQQLKDVFVRQFSHAGQHHDPSRLETFDVVLADANPLEICQIIHRIGGAICLVIPDNQTQELPTAHGTTVFEGIFGLLRDLPSEFSRGNLLEASAQPPIQKPKLHGRFRKSRIRDSVKVLAFESPFERVIVRAAGRCVDILEDGIFPRGVLCRRGKATALHFVGDLITPRAPAPAKGIRTIGVRFPAIIAITAAVTITA